MYESEQPGPYAPAALSTSYRAIKLQSNASAVDLTVTSGTETGISLHLEPGELHTGSTIITAAASLVGVLGYPPQPNSGN